MGRSVPLWSILLVAACSLLAVVESREVVCYYGTWAVYRQNGGGFDINNINPALCTQLVYAFFDVGPDGSIVPLDATVASGQYNMLAKFSNLKQRYPALKTIAAVGGWSAIDNFTPMATNAQRRATFVRSVVALLQKYRFDGLDVDWEYPTDKGVFVQLLRDLAAAFAPSKYLLTVAVGGTSFEAINRYDIPAIASIVNFINLMTYDLQGDYGVTRHQAALYPGSAALDNSDYKRALNAEAVITYWLSKGAPASKLNLGIPLYGRTFKLTNPVVNGVGAPVSGVGTKGPITQEEGILAYYEICSSPTLTRKQYDSAQVGAFASGGGEWVSYDSVESIGQKCNVIAKYGLGGGMVWAIDMDDFAGKCGSKFPLMTALNNCVNRNGAVALAPAPTPAPTTVRPATATTARQIVTTTTTKPVTPSSGVFVCPRDGYFRDPRNCAKFYRCYDGGRQALYDCPGGLCFNEAITACDWPYNVKC
uniref:chitinase-3-like protein 1 n=1 Tax=Anopheles coluzzii TaxID=1518534 RepID=UPI0020FFE721|nr:chitinase-3-like protein 1 [Anopheles coluzzii]